MENAPASTNEDNKGKNHERSAASEIGKPLRRVPFEVINLVVSMPTLSKEEMAVSVESKKGTEKHQEATFDITELLFRLVLVGLALKYHMSRKRT